MGAQIMFLCGQDGKVTAQIISNTQKAPTNDFHCLILEINVRVMFDTYFQSRHICQFLQDRENGLFVSPFFLK